MRSREGRIFSTFFANVCWSLVHARPKSTGGVPEDREFVAQGDSLNVWKSHPLSYFIVVQRRVLTDLGSLALVQTALETFPRRQN